MNNDKIFAKYISHGPSCEMANCRNALEPSVKKSYFRFPQHDYFCSQWVFACARPDLVELYLNKGSMYLYKTKKICEEHFSKKDFRNPAMLRQGLYKGVVPTKHLPEMDTVLTIIVECPDANEDSVGPPLPAVVQPKIKKSSRISQKNQIKIKTVNKIPPTRKS